MYLNIEDRRTVSGKIVILVNIDTYQATICVHINKLQLQKLCTYIGIIFHNVSRKESYYNIVRLKYSNE